MRIGKFKESNHYEIFITGPISYKKTKENGQIFVNGKEWHKFSFPSLITVWWGPNSRRRWERILEHKTKHFYIHENFAHLLKIPYPKPYKYPIYIRLYEKNK